jgi:hypothetical protein
MPRYAPLFRLEVVHRYFANPDTAAAQFPNDPGRQAQQLRADAAKLALEFRPDPQTAAWLELTGSVMKSQANSLSVFYDTEGRGGGPPAAANQPVELGFEATADDPLFAEYTDGPPPPNLRPPRFSLLDAKPDADGVWRLGETSGPGLSARVSPVCFRIELPISADLAEAGRSYRLDLASRAIGWKYILLDAWDDARPMVVDTAGAIRFDDPSPETLADGTQALTIVSQAPIALAERPAQRFQLCARQDDGAPGRVLIAALPAAAPGRLGLHRRPPAAPALVTEIYVAR